MEQFLPKLMEYGVLAVVVCILFFILWQIICWAKTFISGQALQYFNSVTELTKQHNTERIAWLETLANLHHSIELHNQNSIEARKATEEAHKYQKAEHEKLSESMNIVCNSLKQTEQSLGRINGYIKEG
ncbi:MAG: hypothetical protein ACYDEX_21425 [Mobilitalea sp.]